VALGRGWNFGNPCKRVADPANVSCELNADRRHRKNETEIWGKKLFTSYTHPVSWLIRQDSQTKNSAFFAQEKKMIWDDKKFLYLVDIFLTPSEVEQA